MQYRSYAVISNRRVADQEEEAIVELNKKVVVSLLDAAMVLARQGLAFLIMCEYALFLSSNA